MLQQEKIYMITAFTIGVLQLIKINLCVNDTRWKLLCCAITGYLDPWAIPFPSIGPSLWRKSGGQTRKAYSSPDFVYALYLSLSNFPLGISESIYTAGSCTHIYKHNAAHASAYFAVALPYFFFWFFKNAYDNIKIYVVQFLISVLHKCSLELEWTYHCNHHLYIPGLETPQLKLKLISCGLWPAWIIHVAISKIMLIRLR